MNQLGFKKIYFKYAFLAIGIFLLSIMLGILLSDVMISIFGVIIALFFLYPIYSFKKIEKSGNYSFQKGVITSVQFHAKTSVIVPRAISKDIRIEIQLSENNRIKLIVPQLDYLLFDHNQIYEGSSVRLYYALDNTFLFFETVNEGNEIY